MSILLFIISAMILLSSCGISKHLVYIDDWEGNYTLREYNSCCDSSTQVKLKLIRTNSNEYDWKMFFTRNGKDTIFGKAMYQKNKLQFFIMNAGVANQYFADAVSSNRAAFRLEYDNYYSDKDFLYIGHYTRWTNELKDYKEGKALFAGRSYHFKKDGVKENKKIRKA